jgi:hypothetical protein
MLQELENAIHHINSDIYFSSGEVEYLDVRLIVTGYTYTVKFLDIEIWNSEDDMREDINESGDKEDIEGYLRREIRRELNKLSKIAV